MQEMQETWVQSLGWEDALEEDTATHSSILAWRIHGQRSLADTANGVGKSDMTDYSRRHALETAKAKPTLPENT